MQHKNIKPYNFKFTEDNPNVYFFTTEQGAAYAIRFKPTPYLFDNLPEIREQVYELVIELIRPAAIKFRPDPAIAPTVIAICRDFFAKKERILLYICETADARHLARVRKFDAWFREFTDGGIIKLDTQFPDTNGITYYISLIFRFGHPHRHIIIDEFEIMSREYNSGK